ncbi:DUF421 domain-containing protein [Bacillus tianshenii]|nr:DUF421 domain-containing protein [Bacillus tianshenii]
MVEDIINSIVRSGGAFFVLLIFSLWIGKQVNSHINYYQFALSITIGSFIANMGFNTKLKFIPMTAGFIALMLIYLILSFILSKSRSLRTWLSGKPTIIIERGNILDANMKKIRYTLDDLNLQLREQGIFDIFEVDYAVLEVSGKLSVLKKTQFQPLKNKDFNPALDKQIQTFPLELIMDGELLLQNLNATYSKEWLSQELNLRSRPIKDVHYAVVSTHGSLFLDLYAHK